LSFPSALARRADSCLRISTSLRKLIGDLFRSEILDAVEFQLHADFRLVVRQLAIDLVGQPRGHPFHDTVKIIPVDFNKLAFRIL
jgi:hypothetical protein